MRQKDVEFCGYSVPHPSEPFVHVRLQTTGAPARDVLDDGQAARRHLRRARGAARQGRGLAETRKRRDPAPLSGPRAPLKTRGDWRDRAE